MIVRSCAIAAITVVLAASIAEHQSPKLDRYGDPLPIWESLSDPRTDAARAIVALVDDPGSAIPLFRERLKPAHGPEKDLPAIREAIQNSKSAEVHARLQSLINSLTIPVHSGDRLREQRAIQALELIGSKEAKEILKVLAGGALARIPTGQAALALD